MMFAGTADCQETEDLSVTRQRKKEEANFFLSSELKVNRTLHLICSIQSQFMEHLS